MTLVWTPPLCFKLKTLNFKNEMLDVLLKLCLHFEDSLSDSSKCSAGAPQGSYIIQGFILLAACDTQQWCAKCVSECPAGIKTFTHDANPEVFNKVSGAWGKTGCGGP